MPDRLAAVQQHLLEYAEELRQSGLSPEDLDRGERARVQQQFRWFLTWTLVFPPGIVGIVLHYWLYQLIGYMSIPPALAQLPCTGAPP